MTGIKYSFLSQFTAFGQVRNWKIKKDRLIYAVGGDVATFVQRLSLFIQNNILFLLVNCEQSLFFVLKSLD